MRVAAIVVAGGTGERFGQAGGKQVVRIAGRSVLAWSVRALDASPSVDLITVVCPQDRCDEYRAALTGELTSGTELRFASSGETRQESVAAGLAETPGDFDVIAIHDGARPAITHDFVATLLKALDTSGAAGVVAGHPSVDTLKVVESDRITDTPERSRYWQVQTPQVFRADILREAYARAAAEGFLGTDDASLVERLGADVRVVEGPRDNIKVTLPEDVAVMWAILGDSARGERSMRIGMGYDVHAFADGRRLILGGVDIPCERGLAGHSDADVLAHAVADAILGALRAGDIGKLFPDTDPAYAGADSLGLLRQVGELAQHSGWQVSDIDSVLVMESPKISPYRDRMRENLASALGIDVSCVGVKATTTEGLGFEGRGEGVGAHAVVLLTRA